MKFAIIVLMVIMVADVVVLLVKTDSDEQGG